MEMELQHGADPTYVNSLPSKVSFLLGRGVLSTAFRSLVTHLASPLIPAPVVSSLNLEAYSVKNTAFAAQQYMLAAASSGLSTAPMEGYDERRLCFELQIPCEEYSIPLVVATGFPASPSENSNNDNNNNELPPEKPKRRFPLHEICYSDRFGSPLHFK
jgi:hypothetical protein